MPGKILKLKKQKLLVIAKNRYGDGQARLAWKFDVYATQPVSRNYIYVDAINGKIILRDAIIKHADGKNEKPFTSSVKPDKTPEVSNEGHIQNIIPWLSPTASELGTGTTRYAGTRSFYTTRLNVPLLGMNDPNNTLALLQYSGVDPRLPVLGPVDVFILKDDTRGGGIETYDMNGVGGLPVSVPSLQMQALAFLDKDNNWKNEAAAGTNEDLIRGATSNGSNGVDEGLNDDHALDAHWGAEMVYDYWKNVHNRLSFDNRNSAIKSFVHYGPAYDNAFWNGSVMTYGDGSGTLASGFRPLTSLDVCAHEIGHGVCSFTSDLVYESESGAMNEALSDIWAACVENYVKLNIDPSLPYHAFQVGEQIAADNTGLRRMDNPKAYSNPDTYGGQHWANPVCTPTLANDQCGVHNNSGVLNKWFYLLVQGPGTTTGAPGYTDDGLADNGAIINGGNNYGALGPSGTGEFLGIGFAKAEAITYLMEQLLTPNATFAAARDASIIAVRSLYGECSQEEKSVTDAWFAVNVGASYTSCALPLLSATTLITDVKETDAGECNRFNEYNINTNLTVVQGATVTINFSVGATTMSPDEYSLSATSVSYNPGETGLRTIKLRIYDDAMVEADETITINLTSTTPALNTSFAFTVRNDDADPVIGGTQTLLADNFEGTALGSLPAGWSVINRTALPPIQWAVRANGTVPLNWTGNRAIIEQTILPGQATYDQLVTSQLILKTPLINASGLNSVRVQFVYQAGGEPACDPACDYGQLVYSMDGVNFTQLPGGASPPLYDQLTDANYDYELPSLFNGKQFYLGFLWTNDANAGTSVSISIDNLNITAKGRAIESEVAATDSEKVNAETGKPTYFYSTTDGQLMARVLNSTAHNYGCMSATMEKAGNSAFELYVDGLDHHRVGDKIIRLTPAVNNTGGSHTITTYFTETEIQAIEAFTGFTRTQLYMYKTTANPYTAASAANTERVAASYTAIAGVGGSFTASFSTGFAAAFALGNMVTIPLPVSCVDFKALKKDNHVQLVWKVNAEINNKGFDIERSNDGVNYTSIGMVLADASLNGNYSFTDNNLSGKRIYYRLKQTDMSGQSRYICSILSVPLDNSNDFVLGNVFPNPFAGEAFVNVYSPDQRRITIEYVNALGQTFNKHSIELQPGATRVALKLKGLTGNLVVRFRDDKGLSLGYRRITGL
jgi:Zn-dependent metalloprotease